MFYDTSMVEPASTPGTRGSGSSDPKLPMYRLAYDEAKHALADQVDELNGIRSRGVSFIAFVGSATAFLAATGLKTGSNPRPPSFYYIAGFASLLSLIAILSVTMLLLPRKSMEFTFSLSAKEIISWVSADIPIPTEADVVRELAVEYDDYRIENDQQLKKLKRWYLSTIVIGSVAVITWARLAWLGGAA